MCSKTLLLFVLVQSTLLFSQVGVGTTNPTQELDVVGDVRVRGLEAANGITQPVSALPDGTLVTGGSNTSTLGIRFVGFLNADVTLNIGMFSDLVLGNELIDTFNEHDNTTGRYVPVANGFYEISMDFDIGDYESDVFSAEVLIGLWNYTTNEFVIRRTFSHLSNNVPVAVGRSQAYSTSNYINMTAGNSYGFRALPTYRLPADGLPADDRMVIRFQNVGSSGTSLSTSFSIARVQ